MPKKIYKDIPANYPVCEFADCQLAATCLHQLAYEPLKGRETYLRLINPDRCTRNETCQFYRCNTPEIYARGFTNFQKRMFPDQYRIFMLRLIGKFSRNGYFERRRGDTALSPKEQETVLAALKEAGMGAAGSTEAMEGIKFDSYEERINWYD